MGQLTKNKKQQQQKHDLKKSYPLTEAIALLKKASYTKFDSSVDIAVNLGIDTKNPLQMIRTTALLPHGTGKVPRVLVICTPEKQQEAKDAGADHVGLENYLEKIAQGWTDIDVIITMPSLMVKLGKLGRTLGPTGLMPNLKTGTVTQDIGKAVQQVKAGKINIRTDKTGGIIHASIGRISFPEQHIKENTIELLDTILKAKHTSVKGNYLQKVSLSTTMGPGINIMLNTLAH